MIDSHVLRLLDIAPAPGARSAGHLSAASGLALLGTRLFVVADDELSLATFDMAHAGPGRWLRLFEGELPLRHQERKAAKPDLEALATLPAFDAHPCGALLAIGSGSTPGRQAAVLLRLDADGAVAGDAAHLDLAPLYAPLRARFADLNIEGCFVSAGELCLLQRGNRSSRSNACIRFDWQTAERWLRGTGPAPGATSITEIDLGSIDGVPLCFTDGTGLAGGGWVFCAAAEDTSDSIADGHCAGSAVGIVSAGGSLVRLERLAGSFKAEGIAVRSERDALELLLVTDADDRRAAAWLLSARLPPAP